MIPSSVYSCYESKYFSDQAKLPILLSGVSTLNKVTQKWANFCQLLWKRTDLWITTRAGIRTIYIFDAYCYTNEYRVNNYSVCKKGTAWYDNTLKNMIIVFLYDFAFNSIVAHVELVIFRLIIFFPFAISFPTSIFFIVLIKDIVLRLSISINLFY